MNIFRDISKSEKRIFKDESRLLPDFLPDALPGREREIKELAYCVSPSSENRQPEHALLIGLPGTGKTSVSRYVLKQLSEYSQRPLPVYINCWEYSSRFAVFSFLSDSLGEAMPRRGIAADEVFSRFIEIAKKENRIPIIILDEADRLETSDDGVQVLYDLCRAGETHSLKTGVIAITNDEELPFRLDSRIRSSFVQHTFRFKPYDSIQLKGILNERAKMAFFDGVLDSEVVPLCSAIALKRGGDARVALSLLLSAGKSAERENSAKVLVSHVREGESEALLQSVGKVERKFSDLDEIGQKIVSTVKEAGGKGIESGKLYEKLSSCAKERAIRERVDKLVKLGVLEVESVQLPMGRTRVVRVKGGK